MKLTSDIAANESESIYELAHIEFVPHDLVADILDGDPSTRARDTRLYFLLGGGAGVLATLFAAGLVYLVTKGLRAYIGFRALRARDRSVQDGPDFSLLGHGSPG